MTLTATRTLAFLFTDIEGSTRLWEQHPEAMRVALAQHDAHPQRAPSPASGATSSRPRATASWPSSRRQAPACWPAWRRSRSSARVGLAGDGAAPGAHGTARGRRCGRRRRLTTDPPSTARPASWPPAMADRSCSPAPTAALVHGPAAGRNDAARPRRAPPQGPGPARAALPARLSVDAGGVPAARHERRAHRARCPTSRHRSWGARRRAARSWRGCRIRASASSP